jgi:hypothetical protein
MADAVRSGYAAVNPVDTGVNLDIDGLSTVLTTNATSSHTLNVSGDPTGSSNLFVYDPNTTTGGSTWSSITGTSGDTTWNNAAYELSAPDVKIKINGVNYSIANLLKFLMKALIPISKDGDKLTFVKVADILEGRIDPDGL